MPFFLPFGTLFQLWRVGPLGVTSSRPGCNLMTGLLNPAPGSNKADPLGPLLLQPLAQDLRNAGLDIAVHYLDDGVLAGNLHAVSAALRLVEARAANIGLRLSLAKSELIAVGRLDVAALHCHFPDALLRTHADGSCRVARKFESSWGLPSVKIASSIRTRWNGPPKLVTCLMLWVSWKTPKLDCGSCGPALASHVCSTACVATLPSHKRQPCACSMAWFIVASGISPGYTPTLCNGSWLLWGWAMAAWAFVPLHTMPPLLFWRPGHLPSRLAPSWMSPSVSNEAKSCPEVVAALACFNSKLEPAANINLDDILSSKQHALSQRLDNAGWQEQLGNATIAGRATLLSEASVGGRAFLAAIPSGRTRMEPAAFISELRAGLQIPDADTDAWCPLCDGVLDIHNYHAGDVCGRWRAHSTPLCCPRHCLCLGTPGWPQAGTGTAGPFASAKP